jgi:choline dehydrogenase-like flavoprotein
MSKENGYDLAVVGSGSAAFAAAIRGAELGASVAMVERGTVGGTCVNVGCIPSKAELAAAGQRHRALDKRFPGVRTAANGVDLPALVAGTREEIRVELEPDGQAGWQPREAVVVAGRAGSGESCESCCPVLNFFASRAAAERWLAAHPDVQGAVISIPKGVAAGRAVFDDVLEEE